MAVQSHSEWSNVCDFLLVVNSIICHILYRFRDIAKKTPEIAIFAHTVTQSPTQSHLRGSVAMGTALKFTDEKKTKNSWAIGN